MNKNSIYTIFSIGAAIIFLILIVWIAEPENNNAVSGGDISVISAEEKVFDFGSISMAVGKVSHNFKIKNSSNQPVDIERIYTSCMCTLATIIINNERTGPFGMPGHGFLPKINKTLAAGQEAEIEVVFDPAAHGPTGTGQIKRDIYIEDSSVRVLNLQFYANVLP